MARPVLNGLDLQSQKIVNLQNPGAAQDAATQNYVLTQTALYVPLSLLTTKGDLHTFSTVNARLAVGADGTQMAADSSATTGLAYGTSSFFAGGSDGVINFDGTTTRLGLVPSSGVYVMTRDIYLADGSQVSGTGIVECGGYCIYCNGLFTIGSGRTVRANSSITSPASGQTGAGNSPGAAGGTINGSFGAGTNGGSNSNAAAVTGNSLSVAADYGGTQTAAKGGSASVAGTGNGVNAGGISSLSVAAGSPRELLKALQMTVGNDAFTTQGQNYVGGVGGNGGDAGVGAVGGGGGGGAGICYIRARKFVNNGTLQAKGGAGAAGVSGTNAGGGGGGGGGAIIVITAWPSAVLGSTDVTGGTGGAARGTAGAGATGPSGMAWPILYLV